MNQEDLRELQLKIADAAGFVRNLRGEVTRILAGQDKLLNRMILALIADGHVLLEGVPGLAKTLLVKTMAQALDGTFSRIQFTPDLLPADVVGTMIYNQNDHSFQLKQGPVFANLVLADEINRAPAKVQSALLECMQERQATIAGETRPMPSPFLVLATQNPIEQEGTYPLPEAQVDRFMFKLKVDYPEREAEKTVIDRMAHPQLEVKAMPVAKLEDIIRARSWVDKVYADDKILEYILDIVIATRPGHHRNLSERQRGVRLSELGELIQFGASPRAGIAITLAAKGLAFLEGRAYVVPQDIKDVAPDVLRHRIIPSYEAEAENITSDDLVERILNELRTP